METTMRRHLLEWQRMQKKEGVDYIPLKRGGAVAIEEKAEIFELSFFGSNGKKKTVELILKGYSIVRLAEVNEFIEIEVLKEKGELIYFTHTGSFVAMGTKESFVVKHGGVFIVSRCGHLYSELSLRNLYQ